MGLHPVFPSCLPSLGDQPFNHCLFFYFPLLATHFWAVTGTRQEIATNFFIIPDENCENGEIGDSLPAYTGQTIVLTLPRTKTVAGFLHFPFFSIFSLILPIFTHCFRPPN